MDHSEDDIKDIIAIRTSLSEDTASCPSFSETFRTDSGSNQVDLEQLRAFCLAPNGLVSSEWRKMGWPKLVGAHLEIWKAAAKLAPGDSNEIDGGTTTHLHHPSKDEIEYIKQVVASCEWESIGILKEDSLAMTKPPSPNTGTQERRVSFHLPELVFSTKRQKDRKTLRKVLIHLKRTNQNFAITSATCSAVAMVLAIVQSSALSTLVVQQLVSFSWKYSREWPRSNNAWELDDHWKRLFGKLKPNVLEHFEATGVDVLEGTIRYSWIPSWLSQNIPNKDLLARIWDVLIPSKPVAILYVCLALLSQFETEILSETDANSIRSLLLELPSKLDTMDKVEAVLSQAIEWIKEHDEDDSEASGRIPSWVTATVAPDDSGMVEYAMLLRETVIKGRKSLVSNAESDNDDKNESAWFSLEGPKSHFALALQEQSSKRMKEASESTAAASSKLSWILVFFILLLAGTVIVGLETDCSVLLGKKKATLLGNNCLEQVSEMYWDEALTQRVSQLQTKGRELTDPYVKKVTNKVSALQTRGVELRDEIRKRSDPYMEKAMNKVSELQTMGFEVRDKLRKHSDPYRENVMNKVSELHTRGVELRGEIRKRSDPYTEKVVNRVSALQTRGLELREKIRKTSGPYLGRAMDKVSQLRDEIQKVWPEFKQPVETPTSSNDETEVQSSKMLDTVISPSEHIDDVQVRNELGKEEEEEATRKMEMEEGSLGQENLVALEPEPEYVEDSHQEESTHNQDNFDEQADELESRVREPHQEQPESGEAYDKKDVGSTASDDPVERSCQTAERLVEETLRQSESASKLAESIVSQFVEQSKASVEDVRETELQMEVPETDEEVGVPKATEESSFQTEESKDDYRGDETESFDVPSTESWSANNPEIEQKENYPEEDTMEQLNIVEARLLQPDEDVVEENHAILPEQDTPPEQVPELFSHGNRRSLNHLEDSINEEDVAGADEVFGDGVPDIIEETEMESLEVDNDKKISEETAPEVVEDLPNDHDEASRAEQLHMDEFSTNENLDDSTYDEAPNDEKMIEINDKATRTEPAEQSAEDEEGPTMLEMAQGLFSRYFEYVSSEHQDTIHLSTPFFNKDDVAAVFEQLMAASI